MDLKWAPEYTYGLGVRDGMELGSKNPQRSFSRESDNERDIAYFIGLDVGIQRAQATGLDMRCLVRWDNPGFDTPKCCARASHVGIAEYPGNVQVIPLCDRHTEQANQLNARVGTPSGFPHAWSILPIEWI